MCLKKDFSSIPLTITDRYDVENKNNKDKSRKGLSEALWA